jgi:Fe-S-cluster containining protein
MIPTRKKKSPLSDEEKLWYQKRIISNNVSDPIGEFERVISNDEEYDIPLLDELEDKIKREFFGKKLKGRPLDLLLRFYFHLDEFNSIFKEYRPCKKGCYYCCLIPVTISRLEASYIDQYITKNNINVSRVKLPVKIPNGIREEYAGKLCPFSSNSECNIYTVRPFNCRYHFVIGDNFENCILDLNMEIKKARSFIVEKTYDLINKYYYDRKKKQIEPFFDIRDYFAKGKDFLKSSFT